MLSIVICSSTVLLQLRHIALKSPVLPANMAHGRRTSVDTDKEWALEQMIGRERCFEHLGS